MSQLFGWLGVLLVVVGNLALPSQAAAELMDCQLLCGWCHAWIFVPSYCSSTSIPSRWSLNSPIRKIYDRFQLRLQWNTKDMKTKFAVYRWALVGSGLQLVSFSLVCEWVLTKGELNSCLFTGRCEQNFGASRSRFRPHTTTMHVPNTLTPAAAWYANNFCVAHHGKYKTARWLFNTLRFWSFALKHFSLCDYVFPFFQIVAVHHSIW